MILGKHGEMSEKERKAPNRASPDVGPKVVAISLPKSGTNVVASTLKMFTGMTRRRGINSRLMLHPLNLIPRSPEHSCLVGIKRPRRVNKMVVRLALSSIRPWQFRTGHVPYQKNVRSMIDQYGIRPIVVVRDPRDVIVSGVHYVMKRKGHFLGPTIRAMNSERDRIKAMITGGVTDEGIRFTGIAEQLDLIQGWIDDPEVMTIRFEEIIGAKGGGGLEKQCETISRLGDFIGLPVDEQEANRIGNQMFGKGGTFRKGAIGSWRDAFDDELAETFRLAVGDRLVKLGYS